MEKPTVIIYGKDNCSWCAAAQSLCARQKVPYIYIKMEHMNKYDREYLLTTIAPGAKTVPIILHNDKWIGGYTDLQFVLGE